MATLVAGTLVSATLGAAALHAEAVSPDDVAFDGGAVAQSLTGKPGDAAAGRETFVNRKLGNCLACHVNSEVTELSFHGEIGPALDGAADRWSEAELRGIVVNSKMAFEGTMMPSFYRTKNGVRPLKKFADKSILTADQVEDVVAYLMTLKEN
ncbi:MAG: sulfur oxidation c-type cytochrome SoxX [Alphaproteobacteria bacterium]